MDRALETSYAQSARSIRRVFAPDVMTREQWSRLICTLRLSPREADVLRAAFYDERTTAIAKFLGLSRNTVHTYRDRLFRRLGVASMTQAISLAFGVYVEQLTNESSSGSPMPR